MSQSLVSGGSFYLCAEQKGEQGLDFFMQNFTENDDLPVVIPGFIKNVSCFTELELGTVYQLGKPSLPLCLKEEKLRPFLQPAVEEGLSLPEEAEKDEKIKDIRELYFETKTKVKDPEMVKSPDFLFDLVLPVRKKGQNHDIDLSFFSTNELYRYSRLKERLRDKNANGGTVLIRLDINSMFWGGLLFRKDKASGNLVFVEVEF
jgi:hypothetical protein